MGQKFRLQPFFSFVRQLDRSDLINILIPPARSFPKLVFFFLFRLNDYRESDRASDHGGRLFESTLEFMTKKINGWYARIRLD